MYFLSVVYICYTSYRWIIVNNIAEGTKSDSTFILHFYKFINLKKENNNRIELFHKK